MTDDRKQTNDRLEAYLDGALNDAERAAFEQELARDPELRAAAHQQQAIDDSLNRLFAPGAHDIKIELPKEEPAATAAPTSELAAASEASPEEAASLTLAERTPAAPAATAGSISHGGNRKLKIFAAAASLAASVLAVWLIVQSFMPVEKYPILAESTFDELFDKAVAGNFEPEWTCEDDEEFADTFDLHYRQPLLLEHQLPDGVRATGLAYSHTLSKRTTYLLATVDDGGVLVFIDRVETDAVRQPAQTEKGRHIHRRQIGRAVLYEVSPFSTPRLLPLFYDPEDRMDGGS